MSLLHLLLSLLALSLAPFSAALDLNTSSADSISSTAQAIVLSLLTTSYNASSTAGHFNQTEPWYWWLSGSAWTALMDYTVFTNDTNHTAAILDALSDNVGDNYDFVPYSQQNWEANDDQVYWLYSALTGMEYNFTALPCVGEGTGANGTCANSWLSIATNAFDLYATRWDLDNGTCNGGLKWQYTQNASGYYYKNTVSNGGFFQTAARLARYTNNATYAEWATKIWDWTTGVGFISPEYAVYDGAGDAGNGNCTAVSSNAWTYNTATYMHGAAHMYQYAGSGNDTHAASVWEERVQGLVAAANASFFGSVKGAPAGIMYEQVCELTSSCNSDNTNFKSSLARWMGKTAVLVPSVKEEIMGLLASSAVAAAASCTGDEVACGYLWWATDGEHGGSDFGSMLSALEVVQSLLVEKAPDLAWMGL